MWFIIPVLSAGVLWALMCLLLYNDRSPLVRRRYLDRGWEDGMRWAGTDLWGSPRKRPLTELDMSRRCFDYYMTGYERALDYKRQREGIIASREAHLGRIQQLDAEIRAAAKELKGPSC